ncbi:MAG: TRAP transporter TatT component family protein [Gammaproteobacteria bacterium]|nr:TRAP transporter TatT component family protein [Gammaproteobacteria bacterium]NNJ50026.1 hypothetical protein [Gammaproteobacteria bacterium]
MNKMMVDASLPMIEGGMDALLQEPDLQLAEDSLPANISMLNGMIQLDPENARLHSYAAQAYYGISYGFNEDSDINRAEKFYLRGLDHGLIALQLQGLKDPENQSFAEFEQQLQKLGKDEVATLFWTAMNWAKLIDLNRDDTERLMQLPKPTAMMQRVLELDETFYFGSAHMYFGVYYGSRAPTLGGNFEKSEQHFDKAREITDGKLLVADLLQAQYLSRQKLDQKDFHDRLTKIIDAPEDLYPEATMLNQISKRKAKLLLNKESQWF